MKIYSKSGPTRLAKSLKDDSNLLDSGLHNVRFPGVLRNYLNWDDWFCALKEYCKRGFLTGRFRDNSTHKVSFSSGNTHRIMIFIR